MYRKLAAVLAASFPLVAVSADWLGSSGADWQQSGNWVGGILPANGPTGVANFLSGANLSSTNVVDWTLNQLTFAGPDGWDLTGPPITMAGTSPSITVASNTTIINSFILSVPTSIIVGVPTLMLQNVQGPGNLTKGGVGDLTIGLLGTTGEVIVSSGGLIASPVTGTSLVTVNGTLSSTNAGWGGLQGSGTVTINQTVGFNADDTSTIFNGAIGGAGTLYKAGGGELTLLGTNSWTIGTLVANGILTLGNGLSGTVPDVPTQVFGQLNINVPGAASLATVTQTGSVRVQKGTVSGNNWSMSSLTVEGGSLSLDVLTATDPLTVSSPGTFTAASASTAGGLEGNGTVTIGQLDLYPLFPAEPTFTGQVLGTGILRKFDNGKQVLGGSVAPQVSVEAGELGLAGASLGTGLTVKSGATVSGTGTVTGSLQVNGTQVVEILGSGNSKLTVVGPVNLVGGTLALTGSHTPTTGQVFTLIDNDGADAVTGTFAGLAQNALVDFNGTKLRLSYTGGTGNDVTLAYVPQYQVVSQAGANGSITPETNQLVIENATVQFTVAANPGYVIVMSGSCGGNLVGNTYTTNPVTNHCTVFANFVALQTYNLVLEGWQQNNPYVVTPASGTGSAVFNPVTGKLTLNLPYSGLTGAETMAHIHGPAFRTQDAGVLHTLAAGSPKTDVVTLSPAEQTMLAQGQLYVNIHTSNYPNGEIRAQIDNVGATVTRTLTVAKTGTGSGTVTGIATLGTVINCGSDCTETFPQGNSIQVAATAAAGSTFTGWSGAGCSGTNPCNITMDAAKTVTANFDTANPPRLGNISTRMQVLTGNDVMIGGFVIGGSANKTVAIVATGPSLAQFGIANALANPTLTLVRSSDQQVLATNDDWQAAPNQAQLAAAGFAPANALEAAILVSLPPGAYTAIVEGVGGGTGVAVVGVYEVDGPTIPLANISTRGRVLTGNDVMIGGFVVQGAGPQTLAIVATGPSLAAFGIASPLANPKVTLVRSSDQAVIDTNDDWQSHANASQLQAAGFAPTSTLESGIHTTLPPGAYTVIVEGVGGGTGVAVIGVYKVN